MKILENIRNKLNIKNKIQIDSENNNIDFLNLNFNKNNQNVDVTYFTCLKMLSETVAKLPIKLYQATENSREKAKENSAYRVLTKRPNKFMSPSTFLSSVELNRNNYGNAYVLIERKDIRKGRYSVDEEITNLWLLPSKNVTVTIDNVGIFKNKGDVYYQYIDEYDGQTYIYSSSDILHFKSFYTYNGLIGKSVKDILKETIDGSIESQNFINNLYKNGLTASMVMQFTDNLDNKSINKLRDKYSILFEGSKNAGRIVPVPLGIQLQPINTSLVDAQFFELKKYTSLQIASAFGIKPNQLNDYDKSSYSNSETQQLSFLVDTMLYILKSYEEEINYKLLTEEEKKAGYYFKFNEKAILRADTATQSESLAKYVNNGIYTPNEVRAMLDLEKKEGGDTLIVNGNYIPISSVGKQYEKEEM